MSPNLTFAPEDRVIARLTVHVSTAPTVDLEADHHHWTYDLGYSEAPRYRLAQPMSPDDAWEVVELPEGRLLEGEGLDAAHLPPEMERWLDDGAGQAQGWRPPALPAGEYLLVRSPRAPERRERIAVGNTSTPSPENVLTLIDHRPAQTDGVVSYLWGPEPDPPSPWGRCWLGLPILNSSGSSSVFRTVCVLFFSYGSRRPHEPDGEVAAENLLIIPMTPPLALDNVWSDDGLERWRAEGAVSFACRCQALA